MKKLVKTNYTKFDTVEAFKKKKCTCSCSCTHWFWNPTNRNKNNSKDITNMCS